MAKTEDAAGIGGVENEPRAQNALAGNDAIWLSGWPAAGRYCGQSGKTVYNWHRAGKLKVFKLGARTILVKKPDIDRAIEALAREYEAAEADRLANT